MAIKHILLFVETPRKIITAKLSIRKPGSSSVLIIFSGCLLGLITLQCVFLGLLVIKYFCLNPV